MYLPPDVTSSRPVPVTRETSYLWVALWTAWHHADADRMDAAAAEVRRTVPNARHEIGRQMGLAAGGRLIGDLGVAAKALALATDARRVLALALEAAGCWDLDLDAPAAA